VFTLMIPSDIPHYPVFFMCGFLPWSFFSASVMGATESIVSNSHLIKKVYFPREILPLSGVLANLVNFLVALIVLFAMLLVFRIPLTLAIFTLPLIILVQVIFCIGMAFLLATANVFYRDTQHIMEVVMQAWFFLTPVFYPITILPESTTVLGISINIQIWARRLNPMASIIASYRDVLYRGEVSGWDFFLRTALQCLIILVIGYLVFYRLSRFFGEEV
jgi:lipopolysaccharide transport system permease protein